MVRLVASLSALAGIASFAVFLYVLGEGPGQSLAVRHLREGKDRDASPDRVEPMTGRDIYALPAHARLAEYSGYELRAVSLECRVGILQHASDGDLHLSCETPDSLLPGEPAQRSVDARGRPLRHHYITAEITPGWRGRPAASGIDSPGWSYEQLAAVFRPNHGAGSPWPGGPARVRLTGWLLYDAGGDVIEHFLNLPRVPRPTDWEIHPVTKIERWDDRLATWVEVRR
jgi:hypothetical protein